MGGGGGGRLISGCIFLFTCRWTYNMAEDFKEKFTLYIWTMRPPMGMQVNTQELPY